VSNRKHESCLELFGEEIMATKAPEAFGPIKRHLSQGRQDHKKGWEQPKRRGEARAEGGHVAAINPKRVLIKTSLAEQFAKRMKERKDIKR
jgi:hypothetical protein